MHAAMLTVLLTIATPDKCNGAIILHAPEPVENRQHFDWNEFHYVPVKPRTLFEKPKKVPSLIRVHRARSVSYTHLTLPTILLV